MARGTLRGAVTAWLGLIALQVVTTNGGSSKVSGVLNFANSVVLRALDPNVAAIPNFAAGEGSGQPGSANAIGGKTPDYSLPYLPGDAVIPRPSTIPIPGHPQPS